MTNGDRLDSWKAISAYLDRNERTVRRWEKDFGLPIRRVSEGRGHSVFALRSEIDEWLLKRKHIPESAEAIRQAPRLQGAAPAAGLAVLLAILVAGTWWMVGLGHAGEIPDRVDLTPSAIVAFDPDGRERWRHDFTGERIEIPHERQRHPIEILQGSPPAVVTATAWHVSTSSEAIDSGRVLLLSPAGALMGSFVLDDRIDFGGNTYDGPWGINDFRMTAAGGRRVAIAAHDFQWWPGIAAVLDAELRRRGTFVNAGWLERLHWLSDDRLLVAGYSNAREGGVVALLDANALDGQSPEEPDSPFYCRSCGADRPLRYVVMPRSELNRVTASRFNRARFEVQGTGIMVRTYEMQPSETDAVDALYEFTSELDLVSASFSERYWDEHRALEIQGRIDHTRANCPERDGPREIHAWAPGTGWQVVRIR